MKKIIVIAWILGIAFTAALLLNVGTKSPAPPETELLDIAPFLAELKPESDALFQELAPIGFHHPSHLRALQLSKERWYILVSKNDTLHYWNSNKLEIDSNTNEANNESFLHFFGDDIYAVFVKNKTTYFAFRIANDEKIHPRLANYSTKFANKQLALHQLNPSATDTSLPFEPKYSSNQLFLSLGLLTSFIFLFLVWWYGTQENVLMYAAGLAVLFANMATYGFTGLPLRTYFLISADSIASASKLHLNLFLYIHLASVASVAILLFSLFKKLPIYFSAFLRSVGILFLADFFLALTAQVVSRSAIPFDFEKLFNLNGATFAALGFIGLSFVFLSLIIHYTRLSSILSGRRYIAVLLGILAFTLFQYWDTGRSLVSLLNPIILAGVYLFILQLGLKPRHTIYIFFVLTTLLTTTTIAKNHEERNEKIAHEYAIRLVNNEDPRAEKSLQSFENQLAQEFLVPEDYQNFSEKKELIESRLKHLYFSNYLEKYELKLLSFDPNGNNINDNSLYSFSHLDSLFNKHTNRTSSAYFYKLDNNSGLNGYIAKYENCNLDGHFGSTYILLQPRIVQSEFIYPEAFKNQNDEPLQSLNDYSFGLYFENKLVSQRGSFAYKLNEIPKTKNSVIALADLHHYTYQVGQYVVVLSKRENIVKVWLYTFTFTLTAMLVFSLLSSIASFYLVSKKHPFTRAFLPLTNRFLSTRIQTSLTIILLAGLLLSVYIIISFIQVNYNQNLEDQLLNKVKSITTKLQNRIDLVDKIQSLEQRTLILNEESSTFNVDINLYSPAGMLQSTTKLHLLDEQIIGRQMDPQAFFQLSHKKASQLLVEEEIEGSKYKSAYIPLFDENRTVLGFVNTPFFGKNEELNKQISNLVVNIVNIYFLLLLGGVILAYFISKQISKPLLLIRQKIANTALGGSNELIVYTRDDEIGLLVKQYNKMVMELEESANQMAESEREGAWREMAKQVAHEIKNPLTPMKLSMQHLQRAYTNGPSEKLDVLFRKTSKLIIEQIESLSNMASEFSHFAKMPEDQFVWFNLSDIVRSTTDLFKQSENTEIEVKIAPDVYINADPEQTKRVFNNLIKNAIQAIPEDRKGTIVVELSLAHKKAKIIIKDNGIGIPKELYKKVFVPNFSTKNSGMGLGLAICRKIVETAKGEITFISDPNKGTTFTVTLPTSEKK